MKLSVLNSAYNLTKASCVLDVLYLHVCHTMHTVPLIFLPPSSGSLLFSLSGRQSFPSLFLGDSRSLLSFSETVVPFPLSGRQSFPSLFQWDSRSLLSFWETVVPFSFSETVVPFALSGRQSFSSISIFPFRGGSRSFFCFWESTFSSRQPMDGLSSLSFSHYVRLLFIYSKPAFLGDGCSFFCSLCLGDELPFPLFWECRHVTFHCIFLGNGIHFNCLSWETSIVSSFLGASRHFLFATATISPFWETTDISNSAKLAWRFGIRFIPCRAWFSFRVRRRVRVGVTLIYFALLKKLSEFVKVIMSKFTSW